MFGDFLTWFLNRSLKTKVILSYLVTLILIGAIGYTYYFYTNLKILKKDAKMHKKKLLEERKQISRDFVKIAKKVIVAYYDSFKDGKLKEDEAKKKVFRILRTLRTYNGEGYVWINTIDGVMLFNPAWPDLVGKNVWDMKDKSGKYLFREMANIARDEGCGFLKYFWVKPNSKEKSTAFLKISYIEYFPPWRWIIGSGLYIDDIDKKVKEYIVRKKKEMISLSLWGISLGAFASAVGICIFLSIISKITYCLSEMADLSNRLTEDEIGPDLQLPIEYNDEVGTLAKNFNYFIRTNYELSLFKKTIEEDRSIEEVYARIDMLLRDYFKFEKTSIYEVNSSKNSIRAIKAVEE